MSQRYNALAHPSLALSKYWGKMDGNINTPATPSLGISLDSLYCEVSIELLTQTQGDSVFQNKDKLEISDQLAIMLEAVRKKFHLPPISIETTSNIPYASGLAGSSAFFAALAASIALCAEHEYDVHMTSKDISNIARIGSASASRAVFSGFQYLDKGAIHAESIFPKEHWPDLRVLCVIVHTEKKSISSREAMQLCKKTSPFYQSWCTFAEEQIGLIRSAVAERDIGSLGPLMTHNAYAMFGAMIASHPSIRYWNPQSLLVLNVIKTLRKQGYAVWETMDAGAQVKLIYNQADGPSIRRSIESHVPDARLHESCVGSGVDSWKE